MTRLPRLLLAVVVLLAAGPGHAAQTWTENVNYVHLRPEQRTSVAPGKVEVMEVFSYACPACNNFQPVMDKLRRSLPPNAQLVYLPAAFHPEEDWAMFQRAFFAAQALGIVDKTHQGIFDAVWKSGQLAVVDPDSHRLKSHLPTIADAAAVYARLAGIKAEDFVAAGNSFAVDVKARGADAQILAMEIPGTPSIVVNGRYRIVMDSVPQADQLIELVKYLVAKESGH
jgi:protein dithiol oxidoreductase (disulfide-forming)